MKYVLKKHLRKNKERALLVARTLRDMVIYVLGSSPRLSLANGEKKQIIFLGDHLMARIPRIAKWLTRTGKFDCYLITLENKNLSTYNTHYFKQVFTYQTNWGLQSLLKHLEGAYIIHAFTPRNKTIRTVIDHARVPVVLDVQDLYVSNYELNPPQLYMKLDLPHEKYCLEHASGIISQSHEVYYARRIYQVTKRPPTLFFPLFCDDDHCLNPQREFDPEEVHIVYAGSVYGSAASKAHFGNMQFFDLIEYCNRDRIHFHLYPTPSVTQEALEEYGAIADSSTYFHLHDTVPQDKLAEELSQYHFGILPFFNSGTQRSLVKRAGATSLKIFNYLEAGLPILISEDTLFQKWIMGRLGGVVPINDETVENLRNIIHDVDYPELLAKLFRQRKKALLSKEIGRVVKFYHYLAESPTRE